MPKLRKEEDEIVVEISPAMIASIKDDMAKFGFDGEQYEEFLMSVGAMKPGHKVTMFPNIEMEEYRTMFVKKYESSLGDTFALSNTKVKKLSEGGKPYETGWFIPRKMFDIIRDNKV